MKTQLCYGGVRYLDGAGPCLPNIERLDNGAMSMIHYMANRGLQVDLSHFAKMEVELQQDKEEITERVKDITGLYCNLDSPDQVSELLFKKLGLKQPRPRLTKSGDRESVDYESLVAVQHDHECVPHIIAFKEVSKLFGTYVKPMPKLARRSKFGEWRMYPNFGVTRIPSGRLNCIAKGTPIEIVRDVSKYPKGIPIEEVEKGDLAYSFDENLNLTLRYVKKVWKTGNEVCLRIHWLGTGRKHKGYLDLTPQHLVRLTSGEYKMAGSLRKGDRVCSLARGVGRWGYARLYASGIGEIPKEHRFIWDQLYGTGDGKHIHHRDDNKLNNIPSNLESLSPSDHWSHHRRNHVMSQAHRDNLRLAYYRSGIGRKTFEERSSYQENHKLNLTREWIEEELLRFKGSPTKLCKSHGIDYATFQKYCRLHSVDWKVIAKKYKLESNHVVMDVEILGEREVWDMEIEDTHNFIAGELCVHNCKEPNLLAMPNKTTKGKRVCEGFITDPGWVYLSVDLSQIEPRTIAHRSGDPALMNVYLNQEDIYSDYAVSAFKIQDKRYRDDKGKWKYPGVDKEKHRFPSKTCVLAWFYRVTAMGLLEQMPVICATCGKESILHDCGHFTSLWNENNCQDLINAACLKYPGVLKMWRKDDATARKHGLTWDDWGRIMHVAAVRSVNDWVVSAALREAGNMPVQSSAQGPVKLSMAQVQDELTEWKMMGEVYHPLLQIHDEILGEVKEDEAQDIGQYIIHTMENSVRLRVPLKAEMATSINWGSMIK